MTLSPSDGICSGDLAAQLSTHRAELGLRYQGRWHWFWRRRRGMRRLETLRRTACVVIRDYDVTVRQAQAMTADIHRTRRRQVWALRIRIVLATIMNLLRRYGLAILGLIMLAGIAYGVWLYWPVLVDLISAMQRAPAPVIDSGDAFSGSP